MEPERQPHHTDKQDSSGSGESRCPQHERNILLTLAGLQDSPEPVHGLAGSLLQRFPGLEVDIPRQYSKDRMLIHGNQNAADGTNRGRPGIDDPRSKLRQGFNADLGLGCPLGGGISL